MTLFPGEGVGPEVIAAAREVVEATGVRIDWDVQQVGAPALAAHGTPLPDAAVESLRERGVGLKGPVATPPSGFRSINIGLRQALGLHTGVRPSRSFPGAPSPSPGMDVVVTRMLDGDLYAGIEYAPDDPAAADLRRVVAERGNGTIPEDAGIGLKPISPTQVERAARAALRWARANDRRRVTIVHKATLQRATDALFLETADEVARREFSDLEVDDRLVDAVCHDLAARPGTFDVLFSPIVYSDLLSDLCAGLTGGLGLAPGCNLGDDCALFESVHGTAPRLAGSGRANPMAAMLSGAMMLRHLGEADAAGRLVAAVADLVAEGRTVTYDLRPGRDPVGAARTGEVAEAVAARLRG